MVSSRGGFQNCYFTVDAGMRVNPVRVKPVETIRTSDSQICFPGMQECCTFDNQVLLTGYQCLVEHVRIQCARQSLLRANT